MVSSRGRERERDRERWRRQDTIRAGGGVNGALGGANIDEAESKRESAPESERGETPLTGCSHLCCTPQLRLRNLDCLLSAAS